MRGLSRAVALAACAALLLAACSSSPKRVPTPSTTLPTTPGLTASATTTGLPPTPPITATATPGVTQPSSPPASAPPPTARPPGPPATPGATLQSAEAYVQAQNTLGGSLSFVNPAQTWVDANTLHALHAQPTGAAGIGGDTFYFFVHGVPVGHITFTQSVRDGPVNSTTYSVTYDAYKPGDATCCPSGGTTTVAFQWNGSSLITLGSLAGATLS